MSELLSKALRVAKKVLIREIFGRGVVPEVYIYTTISPYAFCSAR